MGNQKQGWAIGAVVFSGPSIKTMGSIFVFVKCITVLATFGLAPLGWMYRISGRICPGCARVLLNVSWFRLLFVLPSTVFDKCIAVSSFVWLGSLGLILVFVECIMVWATGSLVEPGLMYPSRGVS